MADEKIIQIYGDGQEFNVLTNQGRLFKRIYDGIRQGYDYEEIDLPDLKKSKPRQAKESGYSDKGD